MGAAQAEVDEGAMARGKHQPRRLGSDDSLEVKQIDQAALDQLRLGQGRRDPQDRLIGEEDRALGNRIDVAGEAECRQRLQGLIREPGLTEPVETFLFEAGAFQELDRLFKTSGNQEVPARRKLAHEQLEASRVRQAPLDIGLEHRQLVVVGQQEVVAVPHPVRFSLHRRVLRGGEVRSGWNAPEITNLTGE